MGFRPRLTQNEHRIPEWSHHKVVAQHVPLIDRGPQLAGLRICGQADGVADAGGEDALVLALRVERQDVGPPSFALVVIDVRSRADRDIQRLAVRREFEVARPVPTATDALIAAGDVRDDFFRLARRLRVAVLIREANNRVGVPDVVVRPLGNAMYVSRFWRTKSHNERVSSDRTV